MHRAKQEILPVDVIDINGVAIGPALGPRLSDHEPVTAILETWASFDDNWLANSERMLPPEVGSKTVIRDMSALSRFATVALMIVSVILTRGPVFRIAAPVVFFSVLVRLMVGILVLFVRVRAFIVLPLAFVGSALGLSTFLLLRMRFVLLCKDRR